jgi:NitT/TauT family transport system substrate-binding protein
MARFRAAGVAVSLLLLGSLAEPASSAAPPPPPVEQPHLTAAFGSFIVGYLPLPLALAKGYFADEGLDVDIQSFGGPSSKALQSLIGGSTDVAFGAYDHTLHMQVQGKEIQCVVLINRLPALAIAVRKDLAGRIRTLRDVKGATFGIPGPGTVTEFMIRRFISDAGVSPNDVNIVSVGGQQNAIAAFEARRVDVQVQFDPAISVMQRDGLADVIVDMRTAEQTHAMLGGDYPWTCLYAKRAFIDENPGTMQHLVNALVRTLRWIHAHSAAEIADATPAEYQVGGRELFIRVLDASKQVFPVDGRLTRDMLERSRAFIADFVPQVKTFPIRIPDTYTNRFVDAVPADVGRSDAATAR